MPEPNPNTRGGTAKKKMSVPYKVTKSILRQLGKRNPNRPLN
jgi:hypothetical protein